MKTKSTILNLLTSLVVIFGSGDFVNAQLDVAWARGGGGAQKDDARGVTVDALGNSYQVGTVTGTATFGSKTIASKGSVDGYIAKYSVNGVIAWVMPIGGLLVDNIANITVDDNGNIVVVGTTNSDDFPVVNPSQPTKAGSYDIFLGKYSSNGSPLWATFLGGVNGDYGQAVETNEYGDIIVTGYSEGGFPTTLNSSQPDHGGDWDAVVVKLNGLDGSILWSTYLGGQMKDQGEEVTVDAISNVYVCGRTESTDFPTKNPTQAANGGKFDMFMAKFDLNGNKQWATYYGGSENDYGYDIAVTGNDFAWLVGNTGSADFPGTGASQLKGQTDAVLVIFNATIGSKMAATYYGGTDYDDAQGVSVDGFDNVLIVGQTWSNDFPLTTDAFQTSRAGGYDMFLIRYSSDGLLNYSTYVGGTGDDVGFEVASYGTSIFIAGNYSEAMYGETSAGDSDAMLVKIDIETAVKPNLLSNKELSVFPNPVTNDILRITSSGGFIESIELMDVTGKRLLVLQPLSEQCRINIQDYLPGIYLLTAKTSTGEVINKRISINR